MASVNCEVIEDLLPIYVEDMASPSTRELVDEHLSACENCRQKEAAMHEKVQLPKDVETKALRKISRRLFKKKVTVIVMTLLSVLLLVVLCVVHLNSPIVIPYEEIEDSVQVNVGEDNRVYITIDNPGGSVEFSDSTDGYGNRVKYISCHTTRLDQLLKINAGTGTFEIGDTGDGVAEDRRIRRVYYYPSEGSGEAVCLYDDKSDLRVGGVRILPRLVLNYYKLIAALLSLIGILVCVLLRKQERKLFVAIKVTLVPVMYLISSWVILWNRDDIYNAQYNFTGILMAAFVLYLMGYWIVDFLRYHRLNNKN